ncbi:MAG: AtzH-like domain-containing protein, partial [Pseudomonadota bacterium]
SFFWQDPRVLRYGIAENLYGHEDIATFRRSRTTVAARTLHNTTIMTYGAHYGTANTEFRHEGDPRIGRQTQTWVRMADGWQIVAAHVSWLAERE